MKCPLIVLIILLYNYGEAQFICKLPYKNAPYKIILPDSCIVKLPDSLGGNKYRGYAGVTFDINAKGNLGEVDLMRLHLVRKSDNSIVVDLWGEDIEMRHLFTFLKTFFRNYISNFKIIRSKVIEGQAELKDSAEWGGGIRIFIE
jgi:hypothetical protein